jgi:hypothetical protein
MAVPGLERGTHGKTILETLAKSPESPRICESCLRLFRHRWFLKATHALQAWMVFYQPAGPSPSASDTWRQKALDDLHHLLQHPRDGVEWPVVGVALSFRIPADLAGERCRLQQATDLKTFWEALVLSVLQLPDDQSLDDIKSCLRQYCAPPQSIPDWAQALLHTVPGAPPSPAATPASGNGTPSSPSSATAPPPSPVTEPGLPMTAICVTNLQHATLPQIAHACQQRLGLTLPIPPHILRKGFWYGEIPQPTWQTAAQGADTISIPMPSGQPLLISTRRADGTAVVSPGNFHARRSLPMSYNTPRQPPAVSAPPMQQPPPAGPSLPSPQNPWTTPTQAWPYPPQSLSDQYPFLDLGLPRLTARPTAPQQPAPTRLPRFANQRSSAAHGSRRSRSPPTRRRSRSPPNTWPPPQSLPSSPACPMALPQPFPASTSHRTYSPGKHQLRALS